LIAHLPIVDTALRTNSTSTSLVYSLSSWRIYYILSMLAILARISNFYSLMYIGSLKLQKNILISLSIIIGRF